MERMLVDHSKESFDAVVEALVENGNSVVGDGWFCDKDGFHVVLAKPIDWNLLYEKFKFCPDKVLLYKNSIATSQYAYEIIGGQKSI